MQFSAVVLNKVKKSITEKILFGNELNPELIAILLVYFVEGILGLARLAVSFFLKDELGLSPSEVSALFGISVLPWVIKPLLGFMSDGFPVFGYRRRPYLILSGILGGCSWIALSTIVDNAGEATCAITLGSLAIAFSDVIIDSLVVERAKSESVSDIGSLQSLCKIASALGGIITAYLSGYLLQTFGSKTIFLITALFPLIVSGVAWLIAEVPYAQPTDWKNIKTQLVQLRQVISQKKIWIPVGVMFVWQATPSSDAAFFFFTTNELGFEPEFLGRVRLVTSLATLFGIWLFQRFLKSLPFRTIFTWAAIISILFRLTPLILVTHANRSLGIDDHWFSIGDSLILTVMGQITYMPLLVLSARLCPLGVEATLFALLMSVLNLGGLVSSELGALLMEWFGITPTNFESLWLLILIAALSSLLPLSLIGWLPDSNFLPNIDDQAQKSSSPAKPNSSVEVVLELNTETISHLEEIPT